MLQSQERRVRVLLIFNIEFYSNFSCGLKVLKSEKMRKAVKEWVREKD